MNATVFLLGITSAQLVIFFPIFNLDQNDPDLEILNQVIHFTSVTVFQSNIGLDPLDPDSNFQNFKMGLVYISQCSLGLLVSVTFLNLKVLLFDETENSTIKQNKHPIPFPFHFNSLTPHLTHIK